MKAIILAAGLGTRLRPLTDDIPKPMVPVAGVPNIERLIRYLRREGICDFAVNLHYRPEPLQAHLGDGSQLGVKITYFYESEILGTGGGIRNMLPHMGNETFIVVNGDALFMPELSPLLDRHRKNGALASMVLHKTDDKLHSGTVGLNGQNKIKRLLWAGDPNIGDLYMFTGMHIIEPKISPHLPQTGCIVRQAYISIMERDEPLYGIVDDSYFLDLGTAADYLDANLQIARREMPVSGALPHLGNSIVDRSATVGRGVTLDNSIVSENAYIGDNVQLSSSLVMPGARVMQNLYRQIALANGEIMDANRQH